MRTLVCRVTIKDCDVQTFRSGGKGGQNQNKRDTGVRIIHRDSGAVGESREERSQLQNKRTAFRRMAETPRFRTWIASLTAVDDIPPSTSSERIRTYNLIDPYVKDHRTGDRTSEVERVLEGDIDCIYG
jgi:protein subunit release factor A